MLSRPPCNLIVPGGVVALAILLAGHVLAQEGTTITNSLERKRLEFEQSRMWIDLLKWVLTGLVVVIGSVVTFFMIRLREQGRMDRSLQLESHKAYLEAAETEDIDLWQRKLNLLKAFSDLKDHRIQTFLRHEQERLDGIRRDKEAKETSEQEARETERNLEQATDELEKLRQERDTLAEERKQEKEQLEQRIRNSESQIKKLKSEREQATQRARESEQKLAASGLSIHRNVFRYHGYNIEPSSDLKGADLRGADLRGADLEGTSLEKANLKGANLREAQLKDANLWRANLELADLRLANLRGAFLMEASLYRAHLGGANLEGAYLRKARGIEIDQLFWVTTLYKAILDHELLEQVKEEYPHLLEEPEWLVEYEEIDDEES